MLRKLNMAPMLLAALAFASTAVAADSLEDVEKKLADAYGKVKSFAADTLTKQDLEMSGVKVKSEVKGRVEGLRKGDNLLFRGEMKGNMVQTMGETENKQEVDTLIVGDGEFMYSQSSFAGQKMVAKQKFDPTAAGDTQKMFEALKKDHDLKVLADDKVDGEDCFVLEATPKTAGDNPLARQTFYFRKDCGLNVRVVGKDKSDKDIIVTQMSNVKLGADVKPDRFEYKIPDGVQVMDLTKQETQHAPGDGHDHGDKPKTDGEKGEKPSKP